MDSWDGQGSGLRDLFQIVVGDSTAEEDDSCLDADGDAAQRPVARRVQGTLDALG